MDVSPRALGLPAAAANQSGRGFPVPARRQFVPKAQRGRGHLGRAARVDGNLERYDRTDIEISSDPKDYSTPASLVEQHCRTMTAPLAGVHGIARSRMFFRRDLAKVALAAKAEQNQSPRPSSRP
jgi:hypothetical protein